MCFYSQCASSTHAKHLSEWRNLSFLEAQEANTAGVS